MSLDASTIGTLTVIGFAALIITPFIAWVVWVDRE